MSREFPDYVDPWKAADGRRAFQGTMPIRRMQRLLPMLEATEDIKALEAAFSIRFGHDQQGLVVLNVYAEAHLPLLCQRSMKPYMEPVQRKSRLSVVTELAEAELLPEHYDPVMVEDGRMALLDVVEDELILGVPQVPRNPEVDAVELSTDGKVELPPVEEEPTQRPFAGLAGMLKAQDPD